MSEDTDMLEFVDSISFDEELPDWRQKPELGEETDEDDEPLTLGGPGSGRYPKGSKNTIVRVTSDELEALISYRYDKKFYAINGPLREGGIHPDPIVQKWVTDLDSVIAKTAVEEDTVVYRGMTGVGAGSFEAAQAVKAMKPGDTFIDRGFASTTKNRSVAIKFGFDASVGAVLRIIVPKGHPLLDVNGSMEGKYKGEQEFLLPRGTTFERTDEVVRGKVHMITLKVVRG